MMVIDKSDREFMHLEIGVSRLENRILSTMHGLAGLAVLLSAIGPVVKSILIVAVVASCWVYRRRHLAGERSGTLRYSSDFGWALMSEDRFVPIRIRESTVVTPLVIVLHYEWHGKTRQWAIFKDALDERDFRRLIVQLKIAGLAEFESER